MIRTVLPTPAPPNRPAFPPRSRRQHINGLYPSDEHFRSGGAPHERDGRRMHGTPFHSIDGQLSVDGFPEYVEHPPENRLADWRLEGLAGIDHGGPSREPPSGGQRDAANGVRVQVGSDFDDDLAIITGSQDMRNRWNVVRETGVHHASPHGFDNPRSWRTGSHTRSRERGSWYGSSRPFYVGSYEGRAPYGPTHRRARSRRLSAGRDAP